MAISKKQRFEFQIVSDLHTEFFDDLSTLPDWPARAPYLGMLGDIGNIKKRKTYEAIIQREAKKYKTVFLLAGNHEYYNNEYEETKKQMKELCTQFPNVIFMDKTSIVVDNIRILGTTLWSYVPDENRKIVETSINDYRYIYVMKGNPPERKPITCNETNAWHKDELEWLQQQLKLAKEAKEKVVVFTHYAPSTKGTSHPRFKGSPLNPAFATSLEHLFSSRLKVWAFGHTHYSTNEMHGKTRLVSNQLGYKWGGEESGFDPNLVIRI